MAIPPEPPAEPPDFSDVEAGACPRCGTPYDPLQEYCLECGLRLPITRGVVAVLSTVWRRRIPWYPGDWMWPVLLALVVATLAAAVAILATRKNETTASNTRVHTGPIPPPPLGTTGGPPPPPAPGDTTGGPPTDTTAPPPVEPPPPAASGGLTEWPTGQNGYTIVLSSIPQSAGRAAAASEAKKASQAGLTEVGVLNSDEFSSLHSGYYVVFSGIYNSVGEARGGLDGARGSYPQAYTRQITQ